MTYMHGIALMRMGFGLYFVVSALRKTTGGWLTSGAQLGQFLQQQSAAASPPYDAYLNGIVQPQLDLFARLVTVCEWTIGISLLFGALTRVGAILGVWLMANYMLAKGLPTYEGGVDRLFALGCLVFGLTAAGLAWGLDGALRPALDSNAVTRWLAGIRRMERPRVQRLEPVPQRGARAA